MRQRVDRKKLRETRQLETSITSVPQSPSTREQGSAENVAVEVIPGQESDREIADFQGSKEIAITSSLRSLKPLVDDKRILRIIDSFVSVHLRREQRQPTILLKCSYINKLVTAKEHKRMLHAVSESVLSVIQYRYLPLPINSLIKGIVRMGVRCNPADPKGMS